MKIQIIKLENGFCNETEDTVISEHSFTLYGNGEKLRSFNCTPSDLEELAAGSLFAMGKVFIKEDLLSLQITPDKSAGYAELSTKGLPSGGPAKIAASTFFRVGGPLRNSEKISAETVSRMMEENLEPTVLFKETGGVHTASLYRADGTLLFKREDAARHNAVDKVIGSAFLNGISMTDTCLAVSGRISGEIMDKAIFAGIPVVLSKAAPTAQSVKKAEDSGITLIGFIRNQRMNIYTHPWRILLPEEVFHETAAKRRAETVEKSKNLTGGILR